MGTGKALVIGSVNVDSTYELKTLPVLGETILAQKKHQNIGGKGLNQAVALSRMGLETTFMSAIGNDQSGVQVLEYLSNTNINSDFIIKKESDTGEATILVDEKGDNMIIPYLGANNLLTKNDIADYSNVFEGIDVCVLQMEIPIATVEYIVDYCYEKNIRVILNPAPASTDLSHETLVKVDYLVPNETELEILSGKLISTDNIEEVGRELIRQGLQRLIVTFGKHGSYYFDKEEYYHVQPEKTKVVDSTAAGDTFIGAFVSCILKGDRAKEAMKFANRASSITISKKGAAESIPYFTEL